MPWAAVASARATARLLKGPETRARNRPAGVVLKVATTRSRSCASDGGTATTARTVSRLRVSEGRPTWRHEERRRTCPGGPTGSTLNSWIAESSAAHGGAHDRAPLRGDSPQPRREGSAGHRPRAPRVVPRDRAGSELSAPRRAGQLAARRARTPPRLRQRDRARA